MANLLFALNATLPVFLTMILGWVFRWIGLIDETFTDRLNKFVFQVCLPVLLFEDLATVSFSEVWDTKFVLFCFLTTLLCILVITLFSFLLKDRSIQGEFVQAAYRSSAAILGIAFIQNIYGNSGMAPLMIIATVPLYNVMAVVILSLMSPAGQTMDRALLHKTLRGILTNPIILGIAAGMIWSMLKLPMPVFLEKTVKNIAVLATPLGLMSLGAAFEFSKVTTRLKPAIIASLIKLVILTAIFLPIAIILGFRTEKLIAILVMLGSCTTVSCYIMAKNMGHDGILTSGAIMITTFFSAFTLTGWLFLLKTLNLI